MNFFLNDDKKIMFLNYWNCEMRYTPSAFITPMIHLTLVWELSKINLFSERKYCFRKGLEKRRKHFFHGSVFFPSVHLKLLKDTRIVPRRVMEQTQSKEERVRLCDTILLFIT